MVVGGGRGQARQLRITSSAGRHSVPCCESGVFINSFGGSGTLRQAAALDVNGGIVQSQYHCGTSNATTLPHRRRRQVRASRPPYDYQQQGAFPLSLTM